VRQPRDGIGQIVGGAVRINVGEGRGFVLTGAAEDVSYFRRFL
jgi:hypothetical protein